MRSSTYWLMQCTEHMYADLWKKSKTCHSRLTFMAWRHIAYTDDSTVYMIGFWYNFGFFVISKFHLGEILISEILFFFLQYSMLFRRDSFSQFSHSVNLFQMYYFSTSVQSVCSRFLFAPKFVNTQDTRIHTLLSCLHSLLLSWPEFCQC